VLSQTCAETDGALSAIRHSQVSGDFDPFPRVDGAADRHGHSQLRCSNGLKGYLGNS